MLIATYGLLGFSDDYRKVTKRSSDGLSGWLRLVVEFGIGLLATWLLMSLEEPALSGTLGIPFLKTALIPLACSSSWSAVLSSPAPPMR